VKHVGKQLGYPTQDPRVIDLLAMAHSGERGLKTPWCVWCGVYVLGYCPRPHVLSGAG